MITQENAGVPQPPVRIAHLVVAIPARNEVERLPRMLDALAAARQSLDEYLTSSATDLMHPDVMVAIAADACTDATASVALEAGVRVIETSFARVGPARAAAVALGLDAVSGDPGECWVLSTDADSAVHPDWFRIHLEAAQRGVGLLLGSIRPDAAELTRRQIERWFAHNPQSETHAYVHGTNIGVRADVYARAGGFPDLPAHEDVALVDAVRALGVTVASTDRAPVVTSGRLHGRTPHGFAAYLRRLDVGDGSLR